MGIAASPSEIYVEVGGSTDVNVVAVMDSGSPTDVSVPVTTTSGDPAIATVSGQTVTGVAEGTVSLAITDGTFSTTAVVHVIPAGTLPTELVVTPASISCTPASDDVQLEVFAVFGAGVGEDVTDQASFSSDDTSVAVVTAEGVVVCVAEGEAVVTSRYLGVSEAVDIVVRSVPPQAVAFSSSELTCAVGESHEVVVLATWQDGSTTDVSLSAEYSSNDEAIATASLGLVQCLSEGSAAIIAGVSGVTDVLSVEVQTAVPDPDEVVALRINPSTVACSLAGTAEFAVIAEFGDGSTEDVTDDPGTQIAVSSDGALLVLGEDVACIRQGQGVIQATYGDLVASATVNVQ